MWWVELWSLPFIHFSFFFLPFVQRMDLHKCIFPKWSSYFCWGRWEWICSLLMIAVFPDENTFFSCNFFLFVLASGWSGGKRVMLLSWENWRIVAALLLNCKSLNLSLLICEMGILLSVLPKSRGCWEVLLSSVNRLTWILCRCCLQGIERDNY